MTNFLPALLLCAGTLLAQEGTTASSPLTDAELGVLGGYAAEQVDGAPAPEALEKSLLTKVDEIRTARSAPEKKDEAPAGRKGKRKKAARKSSRAPADVIKNGLTEADRVALGKVVVSEIAAGHRGEEFAGSLKKELERLRAERVKASSSSSGPAGKKKRKKAGK